VHNFRANDLRVPPGNRLEKVRHDPTGQYSRVNDHWRICITWCRQPSLHHHLADATIDKLQRTLIGYVTSDVDGDELRLLDPAEVSRLIRMLNGRQGNTLDAMFLYRNMIRV
jgi:hypothetical protein